MSMFTVSGSDTCIVLNYRRIRGAVASDATEILFAHRVSLRPSSGRLFTEYARVGGWSRCWTRNYILIDYFDYFDLEN